LIIFRKNKINYEIEIKKEVFFGLKFDYLLCLNNITLVYNNFMIKDLID
jgi:hypothetical protein